MNIQPHLIESIVLFIFAAIAFAVRMRHDYIADRQKREASNRLQQFSLESKRIRK